MSAEAYSRIVSSFASSNTMKRSIHVHSIDIFPSLTGYSKWDKRASWRKKSTMMYCMITLCSYVKITAITYSFSSSKARGNFFKFCIVISIYICACVQPCSLPHPSSASSHVETFFLSVRVE